MSMSKILMKKILKILLPSLGIFILLLLFALVFFFLYFVYVRHGVALLRIEYELIEVGASEDRISSLLGRPSSIELHPSPKKMGTLIRKNNMSYYERLLNSKEEKKYRYLVKYNIALDGSCYFIIKDHIVTQKHFYE